MTAVYNPFIGVYSERCGDYSPLIKLCWVRLTDKTGNQYSKTIKSNAKDRHQENKTQFCDVNTFLYSICSTRRWCVLGRGATQDEKDFINTINSSARVSSIFSEQCSLLAKRMIALSWQNINRVKISQWFRELYSCHRLEKITYALKGRDKSKFVGSINVKYKDESDIPGQ